MVENVTAAFRDSSVISWRNLRNLQRTPGAIVTSLAQPIIFVLLLAYVFGGSFGGASYREYLIGGIVAQTLTFNSSFTAVYLAKDLDLGIIQRFRALPMSRVAVILGRTVSDLLVANISVAVTLLVGLVIGWRVHSSLGSFLLTIPLILLFAFAISWIGALIALTAKSVEVTQTLGLIWLFPVTFVSGAFVPIANLPAPLQVIAEWNPVTAVGQGLRSLMGNTPPPGFPTFDAWPMQNPDLYAVFSSLAIIAIAAPIACWRYTKIEKK